MSAVIYNQPKNRLAKLLRTPGGISHAAALAGAQGNLDQLAPSLLAAVDVALAVLDEMAMSAASEPTPGPAAAACYRSAAEVAGLAGLCGHARLGEVAHSLCSLVDHHIAAGTWSTPAVTAHLSVIGLLRASIFAEGSDEAAEILNGLRALVRRAESRPTAP